VSPGCKYDQPGMGFSSNIGYGPTKMSEKFYFEMFFPALSYEMIFIFFAAFPKTGATHGRHEEDSELLLRRA